MPAPAAGSQTKAGPGAPIAPGPAPFGQKISRFGYFAANVAATSLANFSTSRLSAAAKLA